MFTTKKLLDFSIAATDGRIGSIDDFYFDDEKWTVRYLIVDTNNWRPGGKVLVSPISFDQVNSEEKTIQLFCTKDMIKNSPPIDTQLPLSRQKEIEYSLYHNWGPYWVGPEAWGGYAFPIDLRDRVESQIKEMKEKSDIHLRSIKKITGYKIKGKDGQMGHVADFAVDDKTWRIKFLVVNTGNWLPGKHVIIAPQYIRNINWEDSKIEVDLTREIIANCPEYKAPHTEDVKPGPFYIYWE
ncbi:MAG: PRC-barrel domain-containing protein [Peptococcaceae bacterium]